MTTNKPSKTIDQVFAEFLAEQEARLSEKTFREYESMIDLLRSYLESYRSDTDDGQYGDISDAGGTYCSIYGPDEIAPDHFTRSIEDHFIVARFEPGKLWLEPLTSGDSALGPVPVPGEVSENCRVGWDISGSLAKTRRGWSWLEVWNVSP